MNLHPWEEIDEMELEIENELDGLVATAIVLLVVAICSAFVFGAFLLVRGWM